MSHFRVLGVREVANLCDGWNMLAGTPGEWNLELYSLQGGGRVSVSCISSSLFFCFVLPVQCFSNLKLSPVFDTARGIEEIEEINSRREGSSRFVRVARTLPPPSCDLGLRRSTRLDSTQGGPTNRQQYMSGQPRIIDVGVSITCRDLLCW